MVLALDPHVIGGVEVEEEELLREGDDSDELEDVGVGFGAELVEEDGRDCVDEKGKGDGCMFEVVKVVGRDGAVSIEGLVAIGADKKLHGYRGCADNHDQVEFKVPQEGGGEPMGENGISFGEGRV
ncbi:hypothetical protein Ancab_024755 [Ancistrocladus abbreviatus]